MPFQKSIHLRVTIVRSWKLLPSALYVSLISGQNRLVILVKKVALRGRSLPKASWIPGRLFTFQGDFPSSGRLLRPKSRQSIELRCYDKLLAEAARCAAAEKFSTRELEEEWRAMELWK
jgi:hypothetical protein